MYNKIILRTATCMLKTIAKIQSILSFISSFDYTVCSTSVPYYTYTPIVYLIIFVMLLC